MSRATLNAQQTEYVSVMENSASALMAVINDPLDYSKLEAGNFLVPGAMKALLIN